MIRKAGVHDIPFCHTLTVAEEWNYSRDEISTMITNRHAEFLIAEGAEPMGMIASFRYGRAAWIGLLIVLKEYRGEGVGTSLMKEALHSLDCTGVTTVRLEAVPKAVSLYEKLGFTPEVESLRLTGEPPFTEGASTVPGGILEEKMLKRVAEFDRKYFGADREEFLKGFFRLSCVRLVESSLRMKGYLLARKGTPHKIGPCVCEDGPGFELLVARACSQLKGPVSIGIPACNTEGVSILEHYGFTSTGASLRMVRGKGYRGIPEKICAIGGPEKG
jgi:GNAT superfamily N-acetyltransferase